MAFSTRHIRAKLTSVSAFLMFGSMDKDARTCCYLLVILSEMHR